MKNKNIIFNYTLEKYNKKYRNKPYNLLKYTKKEVESFDAKHSLKEKGFLLNKRKWALIGDTYYEIPKAPRLTWFRNLNKTTKAVCFSILGIGIASAVVFPVLNATIWNQQSIIETTPEVKKYVDIEYKEAPVVGQFVNIELSIKGDKKDEKQLPTKINKVTTGGVELSPGPNSANQANSATLNDENYYTYTYTKDEGNLYIHEFLGPVFIDMTMEDRTYTITFNPRNEVNDVFYMEVKRGEKIDTEKIQKIEDNEYRTFKNWCFKFKQEDSKILVEKEFDFSTQIFQDYTLTAHYTGTSKKGIYIKGLTATKDKYYANPEKAYEAGVKAMPAPTATITLDEFKNRFYDYKIINYNGKERYLANLSWYIFGEMEFINTSDDYYLSFGRHNKNLGENLDFYNTNLIGVTENSKINTNLRFCILEGSEEDALENPFNVENLEIELDGDFVFTCQDKGSHFVFNMKDCKMDSTLYIDQGYKMTLDIEENTFEFNENSEYCCQLIRSDVEVIEGKATDDTIIFKNNYFNGEKYKKCLNLNDPFCGNGIVKNNRFKNVHTNGEGKVGQSVVQFSQGVKYEVSDNEFINCKCNMFMIHNDVAEYTKDMSLIINDNNIKGFKEGKEIYSYVGVIEPDLDTIDFKYHLISSGNDIADTYTDRCGLDEQVTQEEKHIFHINTTVN